MPFKSEKQRRFLWAEHPEIAKRWAHEYPNKKKLPMYAPKQSDRSTAKTHPSAADSPENTPTSVETSKSAHLDITAFVNRYVNHLPADKINNMRKSISQTDKSADSKQERVDIPQSSQPVYAGEEREKGVITSDIPDAKNISNCDNAAVKKPENAINSLLTKLSVVLSPHIEQTMENLKAEREGRIAVRIPRNRGIKKYPCATPAIPLPYGMAQTQAQPQQNQQQNPQSAKPVGGGSHPQFNPINAFGAISMSGVINGNAAFGAKNSPDSSKLSCFIPAAIIRNKQAGRSEVLGKLMGMDATNESAADWEEAFTEELAGRKSASILENLDINTGETMPEMSRDEMLKLARCWAGYEPVPGKKPYSNDSCRPAGSGKKKKQKEEKSEKKADDEETPKKSRKPKAKGGWGPYVAGAAAVGIPAALIAAKIGVKGVKYHNMHEAQQEQHKSAGTPAWQRSEGKNDAGGLNEKGRKSYEREHGGNLQAPVTEKNPKGKAKKRQDSFCARMCGMKRVNTGASTAKDPDSRINKSLRKWNCKCSSAMEFGALLSTEKQANPLALAARMAKPGWSAVQAALRASKAAVPAAAKATTTAKTLLPTAASPAYKAIQGVAQNLYSHPAAKYVAGHTGKGFNALADAVSGMGNMADDAIAKVIAPRFRELQTNAISAQRMAAGNLKVPRVKPVGFRDVNPQDWKALTESWDAQDAIRRTLGM